MPTTEQRVSTTFERTVNIPLHDEPDLKSAIRDVMFAPERLNVELTRAAEHEPWHIRVVAAYGPGRKKDGELGARQEELAWGAGDIDDMPERLRSRVQLAVQLAEQERTGSGETPTDCTMCSDPFNGKPPLAVLNIAFSNGVEETQTVDTLSCVDAVFEQWRDYMVEPGITES